MKNFNEQIINIIEKLSHKFHVILINQNIKCTCMKEGTSQADPACKKCLGTGNKIKIKEVEGVCQESGIPPTMRAGGTFLIGKNFYIKYNNKVEIKMDDLIVDDGNVYFMYQKTDLNGFGELTNFGGHKIYQKCAGVEKKLDKPVFLKNFYEIIGGVPNDIYKA